MAKDVRQELQGYPRGWFILAFSDELKNGDVKKMHYFGQALVLFRGEDGIARILDGFCAHMGAHIGAGGKVIGSTIRCPFHHWRYDEGGQCVEIPYCKGKIPKNATLHSWPVLERNGVIHVWYHPQKEPPSFDVPNLPYDPSNGWLPWKHSIIRIKTHSKEIVENVVDIAHFKPVHGTHITEFENEFIDHMAIQKNRAVAYPRGGGKDEFYLEATYHGPGFQISDMKGVLDSLLVNAHTMIDPNTLDLRFGVSLKMDKQKKGAEKFAQAYIDNLTTGFLEDVEIWENKLYRNRPVLCADDGPIMKLRKWYAQFYEPADSAS